MDIKGRAERVGWAGAGVHMCAPSAQGPVGTGRKGPEGGDWPHTPAPTCFPHPSAVCARRARWGMGMLATDTCSTRCRRPAWG